MIGFSQSNTMNHHSTQSLLGKVGGSNLNHQSYNNTSELIDNLDN